MKLFRFLLRVVVGGLFVGHGTQKLFGWFGGHGLKGTAAMFEQIGMRPGKRNAVLAGAAETGGGAAILAGAATPLAASVLVSTMLTAIHRVHASKGPWITQGGYEYNVVLIAALLTLVEAGPGAMSVDARRGKVHSGAAWAAATLALGAAGSLGAHLAAESTPAAAPAPTPEAAPAGGSTASEAAAESTPAAA